MKDTDKEKQRKHHMEFILVASVYHAALVIRPEISDINLFIL